MASASAKKALEDVTAALKDIQQHHVAPLLIATTKTDEDAVQAAQAKAGLALLLATARFMGPRIRNGQAIDAKTSPLRQELNHIRKLVVATMKKGKQPNNLKKDTEQESSKVVAPESPQPAAAGSLEKKRKSTDSQEPATSIRNNKKKRPPA